MEPDEITRIIREASGFADLGMHPEAWELIETLPPGSRFDQRAVAVRLMVCTGLKKWEMGLELCNFARDSREMVMRKTAGQFFLAYAESLCGASDPDTARAFVIELARVWPEGRELVLASKALRKLWE